MAVTYVGNVRWEQASEIVWATNEWGLDTARIPYRGAVTGKKAFEDKLRRWSPMASYPRMYLTHYNDDGGLNFPTVDLHFIGIRRDVPLPKIVDTTTVQTVSTSASVDVDGPPTQVQMEASYVTSRSTFQWIEIQNPPANPRYNYVRNGVPTRLMGYRVSAPTSSSGTIPYATFVELYNSLRTETVVSDYTRDEMVPGAIWQCAVTVDNLLVGS